MKAFRIIPFILVLFVLFSCKKEKLEGDASVLIGKWDWTVSEKVTNSCDAEIDWIYTTEDSPGTDNNFALEFFEKGKVLFTHNEGKIWERRIVINSKETISTGPYQFKFVFHLNNHSTDAMTVFVGEHNLLSNDFPKDTEVACEEMYNFFIRD